MADAADEADVGGTQPGAQLSPLPPTHRLIATQPRARGGGVTKATSKRRQEAVEAALEAAEESGGPINLSEVPED